VESLGKGQCKAFISTLEVFMPLVLIGNLSLLVCLTVTVVNDQLNNCEQLMSRINTHLSKPE
jgi:hypothetical protein